MLAEAHQVIEAWEEKNSMRTGSANANETVDAEAAGNVAEMNVAELVRRAVGHAPGSGANGAGCIVLPLKPPCCSRSAVRRY